MVDRIAERVHMFVMCCAWEAANLRDKAVVPVSFEQFDPVGFCFRFNDFVTCVMATLYELALLYGVFSDPDKVVICFMLDVISE